MLIYPSSLQVEQTGRAAAFGCFGFNGTGGVWRKAAIKAAGGWSWLSITEDLALSYQAFLKGYKFVYVRDIPQRLEVPGNFLAYIQQKHRWTKVTITAFTFSFVLNSLSDLTLSLFYPLCQGFLPGSPPIILEHSCFSKDSFAS